MVAQVDGPLSLAEGGHKLGAIVDWERGIVVTGAVGPPIQEEDDDYIVMEDGTRLRDDFSRECARHAQYLKEKWASASEAYERAKEARDQMPRNRAKALGEVAWKGCPMHRAKVIEQRNLPSLPHIEEDGATKPLDKVQRPDQPKRGSGGAEGSPVHAAKATSERKGRARGRRNKQDKQVEVWTFNSSGTPQLKAALAHARQQMSKPPVAICSQEHHATSERLPDLQAAARKLSWNVAASRAVKTEAGGVAAGAAICTPANVAAGRDAETSWFWSPAQSRGRIAAIWVQELVPCGFMAVSSEGGTERNIQILSRAFEGIKATRCPMGVGA